MTDENKAISVNRWRLVLGGMSDKSLSFTGDKAEIITFQDMEKLLDYLYSRAQGDDVRDENSRQGGQGGSVLNAAEWITKVRTLFPKQTADVLERQALERFNMTELLSFSIRIRRSPSPSRRSCCRSPRRRKCLPICRMPFLKIFPFFRVSHTK